MSQENNNNDGKDNKDKDNKNKNAPTNYGQTRILYYLILCLLL